MADAEFGLVLPFDTDDPEFVRGWEAAEVWHDLTTLPGWVARYERTIHTSNLEMVLRIVERTEWTLRAEAATDDHGTAYDEWTLIVVEHTHPPPGGEQDAG